MSHIEFEEGYGPRGDPARHLDRDTLEARLSALPAPPRERGVVRLIVRRREDHRREALSQVLLSPQGLPGDGWQARLPLRPECQLAVIAHPIAQLIANGQDLRLFGDNLYLDLDLGAKNLPPGTQLRAGSCRFVVTPEPHNGCKKFRARFGLDALALLQDPRTRPLNLRGLYLRVLEAGRLRTGDPIEVLSRPTG